MSYSPHETARADQHLAQVRNQLDQFIALYRQRRRDDGQLRALHVTITQLRCPHTADNSTLTPEIHAGTLANLLAVALDRLASCDGDENNPR